METQSLINAGLGLIAFMGGWIMRNLQESLMQLREADNKLVEKVQSIELLVAGAYVKRDDFEKMTQTLFQKLDKIDAKLDGKANAADCPNRGHQ